MNKDIRHFFRYLFEPPYRKAIKRAKDLAYCVLTVVDSDGKRLDQFSLAFDSTPQEKEVYFNKLDEVKKGTNLRFIMQDKDHRIIFEVQGKKD